MSDETPDNYVIPEQLNDNDQINDIVNFINEQIHELLNKLKSESKDKVTKYLNNVKNEYEKNGFICYLKIQKKDSLHKSDVIQIDTLIFNNYHLIPIKSFSPLYKYDGPEITKNDFMDSEQYQAIWNKIDDQTGLLNQLVKEYNNDLRFKTNEPVKSRQDTYTTEPMESLITPRLLLSSLLIFNLVAIILLSVYTTMSKGKESNENRGEKDTNMIYLIFTFILLSFSFLILAYLFYLQFYQE